MVRILVVGSVRLYREGLAQVLDHQADFEVLGAVAETDEALEALSTLHPDVILLGIASEGSNDAITRLSHAATAPIVALGLRDSEAEVLDAVEAGAAGFALRDATLDELIECLQAVARGELSCSPRVAGALLRRVATLAGERTPTTSARDITWREREVVGLVDQGLSNKEIAARLSIELTTVKNHIHNILEKLGVRRRADAAAKLRMAPARRRAGAVKI